MQYLSFGLEGARNGDIHGKQNDNGTDDEYEVDCRVAQISSDESRIASYGVLLIRTDQNRLCRILPS